ncbi:hypothetical protein ScalyP_jg7196 [Parmales sp. scaly parma]|nr:hypothetical protein ScalyP_jg7196 [Parmales sp. scaly parma]
MPIVRELDITMATKIPNVLARLKPSTDGKAEQTRNALALLLTFLFSITFINTLSTSSFYVALPMLTRYILTTFFTFLPLGVCFLGLFQYKFLTNALVAISMKILPASRRRVYTHEAGHFLIGYLLGYPPRGYETQTSLLNSVEFFVVDDNLAEKQKRALGFDISQSDELTTNSSNDPKKSWPFRGFSRRQLEDLSLISLGGVCAELLFFQTAHGGNSDFAQLESFFTSASTKLSQPQQRNIKSWAMLTGLFTLKQNLGILNELIASMEKGESVEKLFSVIEGSENQKGDEQTIWLPEASSDARPTFPPLLPISGDQPFYIAGICALSFAFLASIFMPTPGG